MAKRDRAIELRDMALSVVKARGAMEGTRDGPNLLTFRDDGPAGIIILYRTPFQRLPFDPPPALAHYLAAQAGKPPPGNMPFGLDICAPKKVLNIEWAEGDRCVNMVSYKPGQWERELEKLAGN